MNTTEFALKLIENYNTEHNRYRRANAAILRLHADQQWNKETVALGIANYYLKTSGISNKTAYNSFLDRKSNKPTDAYFLSFSMKSVTIRKYASHLDTYSSANSNHPGDHQFYRIRIQIAKTALEKAKNTPVKAALGKKWRQLVSAQSTADKAYKRRWEARCAITSFNKIQSEMKIKFGSCSRGGGSMSTINHVVIDGCKIKLTKFLDNALFETAILNG